MRDPRLRLSATIILSVVAFTSLTGAVLAFIWWLFACGLHHRFLLPPPVLLVPAAVFVLFAALLTGISSGIMESISYAGRLLVVLIIASYAYVMQRDGDFLSTTVWAFGNRFGFDLGLVGEMVVSMLDVISDDLRFIRQALSQKQTTTNLHVLTSVVLTQLVINLGRGAERADILAIRGYHQGGTYVSVFVRDRTDVILFVLVVLVGLCAAFLPMYSSSIQISLI
jgi:energy-coupling factor transport system permease protein